MATATCASSDYYRTRGIRENGEKRFTFDLAGASCYRLLQILEGGAESSSTFIEIRDFVDLAVEIREQLRQQEF